MPQTRQDRLERGGQTVDDGATLACEELVPSYPSTEEPVIDGESITVRPGAVTALVGPNGSGS